LTESIVWMEITLRHENIAVSIELGDHHDISAKFEEPCSERPTKVMKSKILDSSSKASVLEARSDVSKSDYCI